MEVFSLWHINQLSTGEESAKLIGIYSTDEKAQEARERMRGQPGFCDSPEGFCISPSTVDRDSWTEGFITVYHG